MRVLQVNKLYPPTTGGIEKIVRQLAEGLNGRTNTMVLVCRERGLTKAGRRNGVKVVRASSLGVFFSMPVSFSFIAYFRFLSHRSDIVQIHTPFPLADLALLLSGYKGKVVVWWHSDIVRQAKLMRFLRPLIEWTLKRADKIIVATEGHINGSDYLKPYRDKCVIIPYGQDVMPGEAEVLEAVNRCRNRAGSRTRFLFVGRLVGYKGCRYLLEALSKVDEAELTIVGDGPLRQELVSQAEALGIADRVTFKPDLSDTMVQQELKNCDVLVLPSIERNEAFGLVQIEAMAWGKPVINTDIPSGVPYVSLDRQTGLTVPPEDPDALSEAMRLLAEDEELRLRYGAAARKRVEEYFSSKRMLDSTYGLYESLLEK
jgi:rhamnosyl/mannosyltransferase